jgi:hypothetical protein
MTQITCALIMASNSIITNVKMFIAYAQAQEREKPKDAKDVFAKSAKLDANAQIHKN